jgi:hypothetical protein
MLISQYQPAANARAVAAPHAKITASESPKILSIKLRQIAYKGGQWL